MEEQEAASQQHVMLPDSITIAQYLNREFQAQDYKNQASNYDLQREAEVKVMNQYSTLELVRD